VIQVIRTAVCTVRFASGSVHAGLERVREVSWTVRVGGPPKVLCGSAPLEVPDLSAASPGRMLIRPALER